MSSRIVLDSDKNGVEGLLKILASLFIGPWIAMLAAGTLAHHHPDILSVIHRFEYWDWVLLSLVLSIVRSGRTGKWYLKTEKKK